MEFLRRPNVLAAVAAGVLVLGVLALVTDGLGPEVTIDDPVAGVDDGSTTPDDGDGGDTDADGEDGQDAAAPADGDATDAGEGGDAEQDGEGAGSNPDGADSSTLAAPAAGTYTYASSGSWSYDDGTPEQHELSSTTTATLTADGNRWSLALDAGDHYLDRFDFTVGADGGLDWDVWVLERTFDDEGRVATTYTCSADSALYRPGDAQGRTITHVCESDGGTVSTGEVERVGTEEVTLGDGTVVEADHLVYRTADSSTTDAFEVDGAGQIDLWLDPETGLRLREERTSETKTTTSSGTEAVYREEVSFLLQSLTPSA